MDVPPATAYAQMLHPGATRIMVLHIVAEGSCWIESDTVPRTQLCEGSIVGFPLGDAHCLGAGTGAERTSVTHLLPPPPWRELPVLTDGGGERTRLVCVYLRCDELLSNPILNSLPELLISSPDADADARWITSNAGRIVNEALAGRPGSGSLIARLTEAMFIEILRRHIADRRDGGTGWLAALADPHLARALAAIHGDPARKWGLDELAREAGLSRTALITAFQDVLDLPPMRYLTLWRLQRAAQALRSTHKSTAQIAEEVGYGSEAALSRALKRETGAGPADWRQGGTA